VTELDVSDLAVERGGRLILSDVSFVLRAGELIVLTGLNGAGKSTLLRAVAGLLPRSEGAIRLVPDEPPMAEACHYFGHLDALKPSLSVADNLGLWTRVAGAPGLAVEEALARIGLDALADLPAAYLSAGQRRRVGFARLLLVRRPIWLLDEPTSALDTEAEQVFGALLGQHLASGGSAIVATHRPLPIEAAMVLRLGAGGIA